MADFELDLGAAASILGCFINPPTLYIFFHVRYQLIGVELVEQVSNRSKSHVGVFEISGPSLEAAANCPLLTSHSFVTSDFQFRSQNPCLENF